MLALTEGDFERPASSSFLPLGHRLMTWDWWGWRVEGCFLGGALPAVFLQEHCLSGWLTFGFICVALASWFAMPWLSCLSKLYVLREKDDSGL